MKWSLRKVQILLILSIQFSFFLKSKPPPHNRLLSISKLALENGNHRKKSLVVSPKLLPAERYDYHQMTFIIGGGSKWSCKQRASPDQIFFNFLGLFKILQNNWLALPLRSLHPWKILNQPLLCYIFLGKKPMKSKKQKQTKKNYR